MGIPEDKLPLIFNEFTQADTTSARKFGGSGLGLTISKRLINMMDGRIFVESDYGHGSIFTIEIPLRLINDKKEEIISPEEDIKMDLSKLKNKKILLVDDDEMNRMLGKIILDQMGINSKFASNGKQALEMLEKDNFDVILMDIHMPELNGMEVTRKIRQMEKENLLSRHQVIVALTANVMLDDIKEFLESGMDTYITKPFREKDLYKILVEIIDTKNNNPDKAHNPEVETNYSLSYINKVTNNDRTAVLKMIERFISVADKDAAKLESYIKSLNWAKALALIGDMKISFGRFKAEKVVKLLNELETETAQANKVNKARINGLLMEIRNAISELVMVLQNVQETTKSS